MNFSSDISKLLTNKTVRMVVIAISVLNVIGYVVMGNIRYVIYFGIISLVVRFFSKNMTIVLGIPLLLVNLLSSGYLKEGLDNKTSSDEDNQTKIDKLVADKKAKTGLNTAIIGPLNYSDSAGGEEASTEDIEGFEPGRPKNKPTVFEGTGMDDAYNQYSGFSSEKETMIENQMNLMEETKRINRQIQGSTLLSQKHNVISPYNMMKSN
jgi:hypothetical protein